jgi:opacity protein-like surface antigen
MTRRLYQLGRQGLFCAAACCAMAVEAPQMGIQALGSCPTGAMRDDFTSNIGYGLGVFADWEMGAGKAFRLGYDGIWYPNGGRADTIPDLQASGYTEADRKCRSHAVTAQYLYYPSGDREGVYFKAGLGAMSYLTRSNVTLNVAGAQGVRLDVVEDSGIKLNTLAGLGYDFSKNWGVLAQYSFITVDSRHLAAVQAGISCRF